MTWYTRVILPCSCPNTAGFADFSHLCLAWLPCTSGSPGSRTAPLGAHTPAAFQRAFLVWLCAGSLHCGTLTCCSRSWGSECSFPVRAGAVLGAELGSELASPRARSKPGCEEFLRVHAGPLLE